MKAAGKVFMFIYRVAAWIMIFLAALLLVLYLFGIRPYAVKTGSMEPAIHEGSLCFINQRTPFEQVKVGQVIAFKTGDALVTHRVVGIDEEGITTKGDANNVVDAAKVTKENYIGKNETVVPFVGMIPLYVRSSSGRAALIIIFGAFLLTGLLYDRISAYIRKREEQQEANNNNTSA